MNKQNELERETKEPYESPSVMDIRPVSLVIKGDDEERGSDVFDEEEGFGF